MQFSNFVEWAFLSVVTGGVYILWQLKEGVSSLNTKIEVILVKQEHHGNQLDKQEGALVDHEKRITKLEYQ